MVRPYDLIASRYDRTHRRWLRHAALEAGLLGRLRPGDRVLDAGCGTGQLSRARKAQDASLSLTLLDPSLHMLGRTLDIDGARVCGSLLDLPFDDGAFDVAVAAWAIEVTGDAQAAIAEMIRVVRPGGHVMVASCATEPPGRLTASLTRKGVELQRNGRFLDAHRVEAACHAQGADRVIRHRCCGPAAVIAARVGAAHDRALAA